MEKSSLQRSISCHKHNLKGDLILGLFFLVLSVVIFFYLLNREATDAKSIFIILGSSLGAMLFLGLSILSLKNALGAYTELRQLQKRSFYQTKFKINVTVIALAFIWYCGNSLFLIWNDGSKPFLKYSLSPLINLTIIGAIIIIFKEWLPRKQD